MLSVKFRVYSVAIFTPNRETLHYTMAVTKTVRHRLCHACIRRSSSADYCHRKTHLGRGQLSRFVLMAVMIDGSKRPLHRILYFLPARAAKAQYVRDDRRASKAFLLLTLRINHFIQTAFSFASKSKHFEDRTDHLSV